MAVWKSLKLNGNLPVQVNRYDTMVGTRWCHKSSACLYPLLRSHECNSDILPAQSYQAQNQNYANMCFKARPSNALHSLCSTYFKITPGKKLMHIHCARNYTITKDLNQTTVMLPREIKPVLQCTLWSIHINNHTIYIAILYFMKFFSNKLLCYLSSNTELAWASYSVSEVIEQASQGHGQPTLQSW